MSFLATRNARFRCLFAPVVANTRTGPLPTRPRPSCRAAVARLLSPRSRPSTRSSTLRPRGLGQRSDGRVEFAAPFRTLALELLVLSLKVARLLPCDAIGFDLPLEVPDHVVDGEALPTQFFRVVPERLDHGANVREVVGCRVGHQGNRWVRRGLTLGGGRWSAGAGPHAVGRRRQRPAPVDAAQPGVGLLGIRPPPTPFVHRNAAGTCSRFESETTLDTDGHHSSLRGRPRVGSVGLGGALHRTVHDHERRGPLRVVQQGRRPLRPRGQAVPDQEMNVRTPYG